MRKAIVLLAANMMLTGCVGAVQSVTSGPRAEITFRAKAMPGGGIPGWSTQLNFYTFECWSKYKARVRYSETETLTYFFTADEALYVNVQYMQLVQGGKLTGDRYMNFVPRNGEKYVIEYANQAENSYTVSLFQVRSDGKLQPLPYNSDYQSWKKC